MSEVDLNNCFSILGLTITATEVDIKKAYRKLSLKFHPDKVSKDVDPVMVAHRFHQLNQAYETLMDPAVRAKVVQKSKEEGTRRQRHEQYQGKRKQMADELEKSEKEANQKRMDHQQQQQGSGDTERDKKIQQLKEQARILKQEKQNQFNLDKVTEQSQKSYTTVQSNQSTYLPSDDKEKNKKKDEEETMIPDLGPLDLSTRIRFPTLQFFKLTGQSSPSLSLDDDALFELIAPLDPLSTPFANELQSQFGPLENLHFQLPHPPKKKKPKRELTAFATFEQLQDAWKAVQRGGEMRCQGILEDVWIGWAGSKQDKNGNDDYIEPARITWLKQRGISDPLEMHHKTHSTKSPVAAPTKPATSSWFSTTTTTSSSSSSTPTHPSTYLFPIDAAYEAATLQRLRDAEKKRQHKSPNHVSIPMDVN